MRFNFEVKFDTGVMTGDGTDNSSLQQLAELMAAKARDEDWATIGIEGGRMKTVGDIRSIWIEADF